jgi:hypothetical protein
MTITVQAVALCIGATRHGVKRLSSLQVATICRLRLMRCLQEYCLLRNLMMMMSTASA